LNDACSSALTGLALNSAGKLLHQGRYKGA